MVAWEFSKLLVSVRARLPAPKHVLQILLFRNKMEKKKCTKCLENKYISCFSKAHTKKSGYKSQCKACDSEYGKLHYSKNKEKYYKSRRKNIAKLTNEVREYKEKNPCTDCGKYFPYFIMEFDHLRDKVLSIAHIISWGSRKKIWGEIEKCELVCVLCHKYRTHERLNKKE